MKPLPDDDIVNSAGVFLKTRPSTPVYPSRKPFSESELFECVRRHEYREMLRRKKYGDDLANEYLMNHTPPEVIEAWDELRRQDLMEFAFNSSSSAPAISQSSRLSVDKNHSSSCIPPPLERQSLSDRRRVSISFVHAPGTRQNGDREGANSTSEKSKRFGSESLDHAISQPLIKSGPTQSVILRRKTRSAQLSMVDCDTNTTEPFRRSERRKNLYFRNGEFIHQTFLNAARCQIKA